MMLAGLVLVVMSLMLLTHRRIRRAQRTQSMPAREQYARTARHASVRRGIDEAITQLDQLARQVHGQLDTRFAKLEAVIRDADERINRLSRLTRHGDGALDVTLEAEDPLVPRAESATPVEPKDHAHAVVWRLADRGMAAAAIAKELSKLTGEVELILSLRRASQAAAGVQLESDSHSSATPV